MSRKTLDRMNAASHAEASNYHGYGVEDYLEVGMKLAVGAGLVALTAIAGTKFVKGLKGAGKLLGK